MQSIVVFDGKYKLPFISHKHKGMNFIKVTPNFIRTGVSKFGEHFDISSAQRGYTNTVHRVQTK
jgi:hypothetical protein